jgi:hypothetical protein
MLISVEGMGKTQLEPGQEIMGDCMVLSFCFAKKFLDKTDLYAGALSRIRNQLLFLYFLGRLPLNVS